MFRRHPEVTPPILGQLYAELDAARIPVRPPWHRRTRSAVWARRRSIGIPLAVLAAVWLVGRGVRVVSTPGGWWVPLTVAAAGWVAVVVAWHRARPAHLPHTMTTVGFIAGWLFVVALDAQ